MAFLELRGVSKGYGNGAFRTEVLDDVNLTVKKGEFVAIVGYSGSGKSTLLSMLAGLQQPDSGEAIFQNKRITGPGPERGVIFQNYSLLPWLSVLDNIALAVEQVFPRMTMTQRLVHCKKYIAMVNLTKAIQKKPSELSGGMRQRVSVARALAMQPQVLLMDEPLGALDALTRATLQEEVLHIWDREQKTVVLITNDVDEAILMADRVVPLLTGPTATLGASIQVNLPRPRDRKVVTHSQTYKHLRAIIIHELRESRRKAQELVSESVA